MIKNQKSINSFYVIVTLLLIQASFSMSYIQTITNHLEKAKEKLDNFCLMSDVCNVGLKFDNYCCEYFCCNMIKYITRNGLVKFQVKQD